MDQNESLFALPGIVSATANLRRPDGSCDPAKIQNLFCLEVAPSAPELQQLLKVSSLLVLNPDPGNFRNWLHTQNRELDNEPPIALIKVGRAGVVADLVGDILNNRGG